MFVRIPASPSREVSSHINVTTSKTIDLLIGYVPHTFNAAVFTPLKESSRVIQTIFGCKNHKNMLPNEILILPPVTVYKIMESFLIRSLNVYIKQTCSIAFFNSKISLKLKKKAISE